MPTIDNLVVLAAVLQVRLDDILVTDTARRCRLAHEWKIGKRNNKITAGWKMPAVRSPGLNKGYDTGLSSRKCRVQVPWGSSYGSLV